MTILQTKNIYKSYGEKEILRDINIEFQSGKIYSLIGPNGSGKTTLLKLLHGNLKPTSGEIILNEKKLEKLSNREISKEIAILNQTNNPGIDFNVKQLISYGRHPYKKLLQKIDKNDEDIINWAITKTGLKKYENRKLNELSGGERQRAWIAMALAQTPKILMLDEPTTYLDINHQLNILELIRKLNIEEKITIIMVLHDLNQAVKYSDKIIILKDKEIIKQATPKETLESKILDTAFSVNSLIIEDDRLNEAIFYPIGFK